MRLFLFAIGGTGARVVRSLTMMLASGIKGLDSSTEIIPIIIDYDLSNGDKTRAINALKHYSSIHRSLYSDASATIKYDDHFFMTRIAPLNHAGIANPTDPENFEFNFGPTGSSIKYSEYLNLTAMNANPDLQITRDLLKSLYSDVDARDKDAELELDMAKGFKGNPNIGSVVFHNLRRMPEFTQFKNTFNHATDRVFIISSIFGGTGASGLPEIVNAIRTSSLATLSPALIGSAIVLPYFDLQQHDPAKGDTGAIDASSFNAKSRAALGYYAAAGGLNSRINAIYYIGDEIHDAYTYNEGEDRQQNAAHVVEFVAATSIIDFMKHTGFDTNAAGYNQLTNGDHNAYEFGIKDSKSETSINLTDFYQSTHELVLNDLSSFAIAMKYYRDVVCGDRDKISSSTAYYSGNRFDLDNKLRRGVFLALDEFLQNSNIEEGNWSFYAWLKELNTHAHKLFPYDMSKSVEMKKILSHKEISVRFGPNPIKDSTLSSEINQKSSHTATYDATNFLKALRDVTTNKYKEVK